MIYQCKDLRIHKSNKNKTSCIFAHLLKLIYVNKYMYQV